MKKIILVTILLLIILTACHLDSQIGQETISLSENYIINDNTEKEESINTVYDIEQDSQNSNEASDINHIEGDPVKENIISATCTESGSYDEVVYCSKCNIELSRTTIIIPPLGHDWDEGKITTEPTLSQSGIRTFCCKNDSSHTYIETIEPLLPLEDPTFIDDIQEKTENGENNYSFLIALPFEDDIFLENFYAEKETIYEEIIENQSKIMINIGENKNKVEVFQTKIKYLGNNNITDVFISLDGNVEYTIGRNNSFWSINSLNNTVLRKYPFEELTEKKLIDLIEEYILYFWGNVNLDKYTINCKTSITVQRTDTAWGETKEYFFIPENRKETTINYFMFDFAVYSKGIETQDKIKVICNGDGDITSLSYWCSNIDWDRFEFNMEEIDSEANIFLTEVLADGINLKSQNIISKTLSTYESKICLVVTFELILEKNGEEFVVLCPLIVLP